MSLIEPNVKNYLTRTLSNSHDYKTRIYSWVFNIVVLLLFLGIMGGILYYRYKAKPTEEESYHQIMRDQEYVLSQIRWYQDQRVNTSTIADLPIMPENKY